MLKRDQERSPVSQPGFLEFVDEHRETVMIMLTCESAGGGEVLLDDGSRARSVGLDADLGTRESDLDLYLAKAL